MGKNIVFLMIGLIIGLFLGGAVIWTSMPQLMIKVQPSRLGFEETVTAINDSALSHGWKVPKIYDIQQSLQMAGHEDMTMVKIISICNPDHSYNILREDANKKITAIMPCRIGVYEDHSGRVFISSMNMGLMSKMFGGIIQEGMAEVEKEQAEILKGII